MRQVSVIVVGLGLCGVLAGCSGAGKFLRDTGLPPGSNPNDVRGESETLSLVHGRGVATPPLAPEPGNVWPGPPQPFPTLQDVASHPVGTGGYNPLLGGMSGQGGGGAGAMRSGESMSMGGGDFSGGGRDDLDVPSTRAIPLPAIPVVPKSTLPSSGHAGGKVVIPNGDGTETVINPDGTVATVPAAKRK